MADVAASLIGVVTFSVQVTKVLYEFGSTVASAKQQSDYVARHISLYGNVLDMLIERLQDEVAADTEIISIKAIQLAEQLNSQSFDLFTEIQGILPRSTGDRLPLRQRLKWMYKKSTVEMFVREIECLKSTAQLLTSVLFTGRKIYHYYSMTPQQAQSVTLAAVRSQCTRAENALVEYIDASESLRRFVEQEEHADPAFGEQDTEMEDAEHHTSGVSPEQSVQEIRRVDLHLTTSVLAAFQQATRTIPDPMVQRRVVLENLSKLLSELFGEWTVIQLLQNNNSLTVDRLLADPVHSAVSGNNKGEGKRQGLGNRPSQNDLRTEFDDLLVVFADLEAKRSGDKQRLRDLGQDVSDDENEVDEDDDTKSARDDAERRDGRLHPQRPLPYTALSDGRLMLDRKRHNHQWRLRDSDLARYDRRPE